MMFYKYLSRWSNKRKRYFLPLWQQTDWTIGPGLVSQRKRMNLTMARDKKAFPLNRRHGKRTIHDSKWPWPALYSRVNYRLDGLHVPY